MLSISPTFCNTRFFKILALKQFYGCFVIFRGLWPIISTCFFSTISYYFLNIYYLFIINFCQRQGSHKRQSLYRVLPHKNYIQHTHYITHTHKTKQINCYSKIPQAKIRMTDFKILSLNLSDYGFSAKITKTTNFKMTFQDTKTWVTTVIYKQGTVWKHNRDRRTWLEEFF